MLAPRGTVYCNPHYLDCIFALCVTICSFCRCFLTLSDPDSDETEEAEECCWGLEMDMGESAL